MCDNLKVGESGIDKREAAVEKLKQTPRADALWEALLAFEDCEFQTAKGLPFTYTIKGGELFVSRKEKSNIWENPVSDVLGGWGLYNSKGELTTGAIENFILFVRFTVLLLWTFKNYLLKKQKSFKWVLLRSTKVVFLFSLIIEVLQLLLRLGTFQLSDLFYNTLGGFLGGFIYWCGCHVNKKEDKDYDELKIE